jgi:hypothetical protein
MKNILLLIVLLVGKTSYSQEYDLPPISMPTEENKKLIDVLVDASLFKAYFINHASSKIDYLGFKKKWSAKEISDRKNKISFEKFKADIWIYNAFAEFTNEELESLIDLSLKINGGLKEPKILLTVPALENNMDVFIEEEYLN